MKKIITKVIDGRVAKFIDVDVDAEAKLAELLPIYPSAFIYDGIYQPELFIADGVVTTKPIEPTKQEIQSELNALEAKAFMRRGQREYWLATVTLQLQSSNVTHEQAYLANHEYKRVYDENTQATALRAQLKALG